MAAACLASGSLHIPAAAESTAIIPLGDLGYPNGKVVAGTNSTLTLHLPVFRSTRGIALHLPLRFPSGLDPRSTVEVSADGARVYATALRGLENSPVLDVAIPLPAQPKSSLEISMNAALGEGAGNCARTPYFAIQPGGYVRIRSDDAGAGLISGFLETHGGRLAIVVPVRAPLARQLDAVRLAYLVQRLYPWRLSTVDLRETADPSARNFVLGDFRRALTARGNILQVSPEGVQFLERGVDPLVSTPRISEDTAAYRGMRLKARELPLGDLASLPAPQLGNDALFTVPLDLAVLGGVPLQLQFTAVVTHDAVVPPDRGTIEVLVNGTLLGSAPLAQSAGRQTVRTAVPPEVLRPRNDVTVNVRYAGTAPGVCALRRPVTRLSGDSKFTWTSVAAATPSLGEFFQMASGRVGIFVADSSYVPLAFDIAALLGQGSTQISQLDALRYDGDVPSGYDYAVVAGPVHPGFPLIPEYLSHDAGSLGILTTARAGSTPTLFAGRLNGRDAASGLRSIGFATLAEQSGNLFIFRGAVPVYAASNRAPLDEQPESPYRTPGIIAGIAVFATLALVVLLRRRPRAGRI